MRHLITICMVVCCIPALGQPKPEGEPIDPRDMLLKMASLRERILQYCVTCEVKGQVGDLSHTLPGYKSSNDSHVEIYMEYSRVDEHYVAAIRDLSKPNSKWRIRGESESLGFKSNYGEDTVSVRNIERQGGVFQSSPGESRNKLFDPLAIGLGFCAEFRHATSFEKTLPGLMSWTKTSGSKARLSKGIVTWEYNYDTVLKFDTERSYWPISLRHELGDLTRC